MTTQDLNYKLEGALKEFLMLRNHVNSGKLLDSIQFNTTWTDNKLDINLNALEYIEYLDEGNFIDDFFDLETTLNIIADFYEANLFNNITP